MAPLSQALAPSRQANARLVIVDDHAVLRQSLVKTVLAEGDFEVVGEAGSFEEALQVLRESRPDIALLDIRLPDGDGIMLAEAARRDMPAIRILFLTMQDDDGTIRRAIEQGADGYIAKTSSTDELLAALREVAAGGSYLSTSVTKRVVNILSGNSEIPTLSERETEILRILAAGARPVEVASRLGLSIKTVKNNLTRIYAKLGVETAAQAVASCYLLGIVAKGEDG